MFIGANNTTTFFLQVGVIGIAILLPIPGEPAHAQLMDQLKGAGQSSGDGALGGLEKELPKVDQASPRNTAGLLQYCIRNNYVGGVGATSVKNSILGKATGTGKSTNDSEFKAGNSGVLQSGNGQTFNLGGSGVKAQVTQKMCDLVLQHAKSLL